MGFRVLTSIYLALLEWIDTSVAFVIGFFVSYASTGDFQEFVLNVVQDEFAVLPFGFLLLEILLKFSDAAN